MTSIGGVLGERHHVAIGRLVAHWAETRPGPYGEPLVIAGSAETTEIRVLRAEMLRPGRPGLLDVVAEVGGHSAHVIFGLRRPGEETHYVGPGEEAPIGLFEDDDGLGLVVDALYDAQLATLLVQRITGDDELPEGPALWADDANATVLGFMDGSSLTVFTWLVEGPRPAMSLLVGLDESGFNHLGAPVALWQRDGWDLGHVQDAQVGAASGWAVALTSLRDLLATGGPAELAGGDFSGDAHALGVMTARMHLALDRAFGRRVCELADLASEVEGLVRKERPSLLDARATAGLFERLGASTARLTTLRTHGSFQLNKVARTDQGWIVADCAPGGAQDREGNFHFTSPLADVAELLSSLRRVARASVNERHPSGRSGLAASARSWEERNGHAFLEAYLTTPGIGGLVQADQGLVRDVIVLMQLEQAALRGDPESVVAGR